MIFFIFGLTSSFGKFFMQQYQMALKLQIYLDDPSLGTVKCSLARSVE